MKSSGWPLVLLLLTVSCKKEPPKRVVTEAASAITFEGGEIQQNPKLESKPDSPSCMCDPDALDTAVLDRITEGGFENQDLNSTATLRDLDREQHQIDKLEKFSAGITDVCLQEKYGHWEGFFQRELNAQREKLLHPEPAKESEAETERKQKAREVAECKRKGIVPKIPAGVL